MTATPNIVRGCNDLLFDADGKTYIDLHAGFGAVFMGHCHPGIARALAQQVNELWTCGGAPTEVHGQACQALELGFCGSHKTAGLYSTGMEAAEFALRFSRVLTGKSGWIGLNGSMHGKSIATAALGWESRSGAEPADCHRLPFLGDCPEDETLELLHAALSGGAIGAVWIEPILGSRGGISGSANFYKTVASLAREHGALLIVDEILTGFFRTGERFRFEALGLNPDVLVVGKACGNGFPVSAVLIQSQHQVQPQMLPGSTFSGNALACATVAATLKFLQMDDIRAKVATIASVVNKHLAWLEGSPFKLRGAGAFWVIDAQGDQDMGALLSTLRAQGLWLSGTGRQIRLLPASTIELSNLHRASGLVADGLRAMI